MIKPLGFQVLVEMKEVERVSAGGIIIASKKEIDREQSGQDVGVVKAFGPLAYVGWEGVEGVTADERAASWGVKVGDQVEFHRYDGKALNHPDYNNYRLIADKDLIGVIV